MSLSTMDKAFKEGNVDSFFAEARLEPQYAAILAEGVPDAVLADWERDQMLANPQFDMANMGPMLMGVWDALMKGDFAAVFAGVMELFNPQANPEKLAELDARVNAGLEAATDPGQKAALESLIAFNSPKAPGGT